MEIIRLRHCGLDYICRAELLCGCGVSREGAHAAAASPNGAARAATPMWGRGPARDTRPGGGEQEPRKHQTTPAAAAARSTCPGSWGPRSLPARPAGPGGPLCPRGPNRFLQGSCARGAGARADPGSMAGCAALPGTRRLFSGLQPVRTHSPGAGVGTRPPAHRGACVTPPAVRGRAAVGCSLHHPQPRGDLRIAAHTRPTADCPQGRSCPGPLPGGGHTGRAGSTL